MKEKQLKYILIPIVLAIWGYTIYKYFFYTPENDETAQEINLSYEGEEVELASTEIARFQLSEEYRDPFLGRVRGGLKAPAEITNPALSLSPKNLIRTKPEPPKKKTNWKRFSYQGLVKQSNNEKAMALISLDGRTYTTEINSEFKGVQVLSFDADSIHISYSGENKTLGR